MYKYLFSCNKILLLESESEDSSDDEPLIKKLKKPPTDEELKETVKKLSASANLEEVTMKQICKEVIGQMLRSFCFYLIILSPIPQFKARFLCIFIHWTNVYWTCQFNKYLPHWSHFINNSRMHTVTFKVIHSKLHRKCSRPHLETIFIDVSLGYVFKSRILWTPLFSVLLC